MGLMDALRKAEQKGKELARRGVEAVRETQESADDLQRRVRQRMRVYPERNAAAKPPVAEAGAREMEDARRKAIVSIHGEDVKEQEFERDLKKDRKIA